MDNEVGCDDCLAALCRELGNLWSEDDIVLLTGEIPAEKQIECELMLYGKLISKPNVNYQAFLSTMKRAWKTDKVECELIEPGFFSFSFSSIEEKMRVLEAGPWSFSSNLLVLLQGDPDTLDHCYEFSHCAFWVHLVGIPRGRISNEVAREVAGKIGNVLEVKFESKGGSPNKSCKARVQMDLSNPLKAGTIVDLEYKKLWLDFRYERLPHFCYTCGRIGHYATYCKVVPFEESGPIKNTRGKFGQWLRAEVREPSPFWKIFYGKNNPMPEEDVIIPETPRDLIPRELVTPRAKEKEVAGLAWGQTTC
ncbi:uncharacterized protein At4g02000-like [Syzygium oleosum]|uniref:uncharacterized protein At4g02000-like n=1 Tax=Syzygium oleosum TaxID=219896 RepID=UPI0024B88D26|nr:uncharacterized protein At4g02000-like [Syzygium oleosum]